MTLNRICAVLLSSFLMLLPPGLRAEESTEESVCSIVYGANWAFFFVAPEGWNVACPLNEPSGLALALWPKGSDWPQAKGRMYVTVADKGNFTLQQFAVDEIKRFRKESPRLKVKILDPILFSNKTKVLMRKLTGDAYGNHELVAYGSSGPVYLILVLSAHSEAEFDKFRPAFNEFVLSIGPMEIGRTDAIPKAK